MSKEFGDGQAALRESEARLEQSVSLAEKAQCEADALRSQVCVISISTGDGVNCAVLSSALCLHEA